MTEINKYLAEEVGEDYSDGLNIYAELDARVNATGDAAKQALEKAGLTHELVTFPGADHAFFNDTGPRHNPEAAQRAYSRVVDWFGRHLQR